MTGILSLKQQLTRIGICLNVGVLKTNTYSNMQYTCGIKYWKILKCLLFLCILGFLNAWWPFEIRMWSSFRFICPVEKIRGRESIHNCEKHWKSICIFVLKTLAGWREREIHWKRSRYSSVEEEKRLSRKVAYWVTMGCFEPKSCKIIQSFKQKVGWKQGQLFWLSIL